jgi:hypothetical protein
MDILKFTPDEKKSLLRVCAAILHLGNIVFIPNDDGTGSIIQNNDGMNTLFFLGRKIINDLLNIFSIGYCCFLTWCAR